MEKPMRKISRKHLQLLYDEVCAERRSRELDLALFRLFQDEEVRLLPIQKEHFVQEATPEPAQGEFDVNRVLPQTPYTDYAVVYPYIYVDNDYAWEASPQDFLIPAGYRSASGHFIPTPALKLLPHYTGSVSDAINFRHLIFGTLLKLDLLETDGEWGTEYDAHIRDQAGARVAQHHADQICFAVIGATLHLLLSGWNHKITGFQILD